MQIALRCKQVFRHEGLQATLVLLFLLNILFWPCIWGRKSMLDGAQLCQSVLPTGAWTGTRVPMRFSRTGDAAAAAWFFEPLLTVTRYEYVKEHAVPLWNPYQAYGTPFAANMQSQPFYPLTILLSLHLTPRAYTIYLMTRLLIVGLFAYFFLRLFVSFTAAIAGGITTMLSGYYVLYVNMPHLSVEILIPAALYTAELLLRSPTYGRMLAFTAVLFFSILGGMPESTFLLLALVYFYAVVRIVSDSELHRMWLHVTSGFTISTIASLALSAFLLLPFLELMHHGYDTHQPINIGGDIAGLWHMQPDPVMFTYVFPLVFGPYRTYNTTFGIIVLFLILIAAMTGIRRPSGECDRRLRALMIFFLCCTVLLFSKRYGLEPINEIGRLPLFRYVNFFKYGEAPASICGAIVAAIGLEQLIKTQVSKKVLAIALAVSFSFLPAAEFLGRNMLRAQLKALQFNVRIHDVALIIPACALIAVCICLLCFGSRGRRIGVAVLIILAAELSLNYVPEQYYLDNLPNASENPYAGAPYISFLKSKCLNEERIFGRNSVLYPDWASVFHLDDIRDLDAMYYSKYLPFLRNFLPFGKSQELHDRFTGDDMPYNFSSPLEKRLLQLSSAKYLLSMAPFYDASFKPVYDREVKIYEYDNVLPRAAIYSHAEIVPDEAGALAKLADPTLNVFDTAVILGRNLPKAQAEAIENINGQSIAPVAPADITAYKSDLVEIRAGLTRPGLLVLNDTGYTGWEVTVDGSPTTWLNANYLFRGVLLPAGKHVVRFVYRPRTFYIGCVISATALICLLLPLVTIRKRLPN